jgi:hypothetical protein
MTDPVTTAIAVALVSKTVEELTESGKAALVALGRLVRRKLGGRAESQALLVHAEAHPDDAAPRQALAEALGQAAHDDRQFAEELHRLWWDVQNRRDAATGGGVLNTVSGDVGGNVVQARDVHGGISFGRA